MLVEVEQLPEDPQKKPADDEDASHQVSRQPVAPLSQHPAFSMTRHYFTTLCYFDSIDAMLCF